MPTWHFDATVSFPRVARAHYTIPVPWTLGLLWPTVRCPGCPLLNTHLSPATFPAGQFYSCTPPNGYRAFTQHQQQNDLLLSKISKQNDIKNLSTIRGERVCKAVLGLHSYTGCDSVSAFGGRGKLGALNLCIKERIRRH